MQSTGPSKGLLCKREVLANELRLRIDCPAKPVRICRRDGIRQSREGGWSKALVRNFIAILSVSGLVVWPFACAAEGPPYTLSSLIEYRSLLEPRSAGFRDTQVEPDGTTVTSLQLSFEKALSEGQISKARTILHQLLQHSLDSDALSKLGVALAQQELYSEAVEVFTRWATDYPKMFEPHYNLALAYLALQRYPEALSALE